MKVAVFGATGRAGRHVVRQALDAGHEVVAFARTPANLGITHERLRVVQADIQDAAKVGEAVAGADAVISVLGPTHNRPEMTVSKGIEHILAAMQAHGVRRLIASAGAGVGDPNDRPTLMHRLITLALRLSARNVVADMERAVQLIRASDRDWTIVRVPMLTDEPAKGSVRAGYVGQGTGPRLSRADMAAFMLAQLELGASNYLRQAPTISN